ncbi:MAG: nucleotide exchange factor GrpE [Flavobacteriaceae bacterium]|nr:nucleotide exchange factor GrpE [Flavobacteriaceae bacterium]
MSTKDKTKEADVSEETKVNENEASTATETKEEVKDPLAELQADLEKEKDRNLRLFAEFENFKKRTARERIDLFKTAGQSVMESILPVLDDFDRALNELNKSGDDSHLKGIELINNKLRETLKSKGLEVIETKQGDVFNADNHEAVTQIPAPNKKLKGKIIDVIEKGYAIGDKIIRYPKVVIGQ